jgi:hypothetical protein
MAEDTTSQKTGDSDPDDQRELDSMADRLEAALERITRHLDAPRPARPVPQPAAPGTTELTARLDGLIERLRDVLGESPRE